MNYTNPFERIQFYHTFMANDVDTNCIVEEFDHGVSISCLHSLSGIPVAIIRQDLLTIFQWQYSIDRKHESHENDLFLSFDTEYDLDIDNLYSAPSFSKEFADALLNGSYDELPIYIDAQTSECLYALYLAPEESTALKQVYQFNQTSGNTQLKTLKRNNHKDDYLIKDHHQYNHAYVHLDETLKIINDGINQLRTVRLLYKIKNSPLSTFDIVPIAISYDASDNGYAVIGEVDGTIMSFNISNIRSLSLQKKHGKSREALQLPNAARIWGNSYYQDPVHVKIQFLNEVNVKAKVQKDLACRTMGTLTEAADGSILYEDDIYGLDKFRSWLRGYGSSAIVLEPESLRQMMIESIRLARANYRE